MCRLCSKSQMVCCLYKIWIGFTDRLRSDEKLKDGAGRGEKENRGGKYSMLFVFLYSNSEFCRLWTLKPALTMRSKKHQHWTFSHALIASLHCL